MNLWKSTEIRENLQELHIDLAVWKSQNVGPRVLLYGRFSLIIHFDAGVGNP